VAYSTDLEPLPLARLPPPVHSMKPIMPSTMTSSGAIMKRGLLGSIFSSRCTSIPTPGLLVASGPNHRCVHEVQNTIASVTSA
jgi:hypothetical protein